MNTVSRYAHFFRSARGVGLLYNARSNAFAEIGDDTLNALQEARSHPERIGALFTGEELETLKRLKVVVEESADDEFVNIQKLQHFLSAFNQSQLVLTIAPTMDCNFRCSYCYEEQKPKVYMTEETEDAIVDFAKAHRLAKAVFVSWYGGEPLMNFKGMQRLMAKLKTIDDKEIVHQSLVTNGYLLDESKYSFFREYPVRDVQFTLDGTRDVHNRLRLYHKPEIGTYDTVVRNMETFAAAFPETQVNLRIHVGPDTIGEFEKVCADIASLRQRCPNINPYPGFITDYRQNCVLLDHQKVSDFLYEMYSKGVYYSGFYPKLKKGGCCATAINSYVVGAEGELYKCWVDVGDKQRAVGTVVGMKTLNEPLLADYMVGSSMYDDPECRQCSLLPVCDGGCTIRRLRRDKDGLATDLCTPLKNNLERNLETHYETKKNEKNHEKL